MFLYFKFLERDGNRGLRPASVKLIGLDWIGLDKDATLTCSYVGVMRDNIVSVVECHDLNESI